MPIFRLRGGFKHDNNCVQRLSTSPSAFSSSDTAIDSYFPHQVVVTPASPFLPTQQVWSLCLQRFDFKMFRDAHTSIQPVMSTPSGSVVTKPLFEQPPDKAKPSRTARTTKLRPSFVERIGLYSIGALVAGSQAIVAFLCFICWLWWTDDKNETRRRIVLNGWCTRAVTLAALVIRSSITAHALVGTAMLTALALRCSQAKLPGPAALSLLRFSDSGLTSLLVLWIGRKL